jgi:hypothetical protein
MEAQEDTSRGEALKQNRVSAIGHKRKILKRTGANDTKASKKGEQNKGETALSVIEPDPYMREANEINQR